MHHGSSSACNTTLERRQHGDGDRRCEQQAIDGERQSAGSDAAAVRRVAAPAPRDCDRSPPATARRTRSPASVRGAIPVARNRRLQWRQVPAGRHQRVGGRLRGRLDLGGDHVPRGGGRRCDQQLRVPPGQLPATPSASASGRCSRPRTASGRWRSTGSKRAASSRTRGLDDAVQHDVDLVVVRLATGSVGQRQADAGQHKGQVPVHVGVHPQQQITHAVDLFVVGGAQRHPPGGWDSMRSGRPHNCRMRSKYIWANATS